MGILLGSTAHSWVYRVFATLISCSLFVGQLRGQLGQNGCGMLKSVSIEDSNLFPALILSSGVVPTAPSTGSASYPEGTCFFISISHVATARHCGEILRTQLAREGLRETGGVQPYGQHAFDPRIGLEWRAVKETGLKTGDISILEVTPEVSVHEDSSRYLPWCEIWGSIDHPQHPVIRMTPISEGEPLCFRGFTDIEFTCGDEKDEMGRLKHGVSAIGIIGCGPASWQEIENSTGIEHRLVIDGVAAKGQNSGSPVFDTAGRIVGVVSLSPQDGYTVIAPFYDGDAERQSGARHLTDISLYCAKNQERASLAVLCDFGH